MDGRTPIIFTKVGGHEKETLEEILERKLYEELTTGQIWWGFGTVKISEKRFLKFTEEYGKREIKVLMIPIKSQHNPPKINEIKKIIEEKNFQLEVDTIKKSSNSFKKRINNSFEGINTKNYVLGSKWAIVLKDLKDSKIEISDENYQDYNLIGESKKFSNYNGNADTGTGFLIKGRGPIKVSYEAKLLYPYWLYISNKCLRCGSENTIPIIYEKYEELNQDDKEKIAKNKIKLNEDIECENKKYWYCKKCEYEFNNE